VDGNPEVQPQAITAIHAAQIQRADSFISQRSVALVNRHFLKIHIQAVHNETSK